MFPKWPLISWAANVGAAQAREVAAIPGHEERAGSWGHHSRYADVTDDTLSIYIYTHIEYTYIYT